jgi:serine/threonine protein phosphatase PrpC
MKSDYIEIYHCSDKGLVRELNEDTLASHLDLGLVVLADGMGGCQAGEVASRIAVETVIQDMWQPRKQTESKTLIKNKNCSNGLHRVSILLEQAVVKANQAIFQESEANISRHGMGTTVVTAIFDRDFISIAHIGDSRLYRLRGDEFKLLTKDHSIVQELVDCGLYTEAEARIAPQRHLLTRALGVATDVIVDVQEQHTLPEDIYLFCSDGLSDMLCNEEIAELIQNSRYDLEQAVRALVDAANSKGGVDNISVVLVRILPNSNYPRQWWHRLFSSAKMWFV